MILDSYGNRRFYGVYRGLVTDNRDPLNKGRVKLQIPQVLATEVTDWAWGVYTPGVQHTPPNIGQGVFVQFEGGDPSFPIWTLSFDSNGSVDFLQLNTSYTEGSTEVGMFAWDTYAQTPQIKVGNGEVTLQVGQEFHIIVSNQSGATIASGSVVYFNGGLGSGGHPTVLPYLADGTKRSFLVAGIATQDIPNGTEGLVTSKGVVNDLDTSMYAVGDVLFASPLFTGNLTNTQPTPPDEVVVVGVVTNSSATVGEIYVTITPIIQQLTTTLTLYQTNVNSDISGYFKMVNSQLDPSYNTTAVTIPVPDSVLGGTVGTSVLLSKFVAPANLFTGDPGAAVTITTAGNIMKTSGNTNTQTLFYFEIYKRNSMGTETLIGTSGQTGPSATVTLNIWQQFSESVTASLGSFTNTDRLVVKFYAYIAQASGAQSYAFQFGGSQPVRTTIPVPVSVVSTSPATGVSVDTTNFNLNLSSADNTVQKALDTLDNLNVGVTSVSGTSGSVTVTNGSTTPVISLTSAYGDSVNPYGTKTANTVLAGPATGSALAPTFRALVSDDIPSLSATKITSETLVASRGGTGVSNADTSTITLGGALTFSGAFTTAITVTGNTAVTLPTTGTLVNSAVTTLSSLTSIGTLTGLTVTGTGTNTVSLTTGTTGALTLETGSTGAINMGTNANAKTITIGNNSVATSIALNGTGGVTVGSDFTVSGGDIKTGAAVASALFNTTTTGNVSLATGLTSGTFTVGGTGSTGAVSLFPATGGQNITLGGATTGTVTLGSTSATAVQLPTGKTKVGQTTLVQGGAVSITLPTLAGTLATKNDVGLVPIIPTSVTVGSGSGSVATDGLITFTGSSSVLIRGIFSADYTDYIIRITVSTASAASVNRMRFGTNGSANSTTNYMYGGIALDSANTTTTVGAESQTSGVLMEVYSTAGNCSAEIKVFAPQQTLATSVVSHAMGRRADGGYRSNVQGTIFTLTTSFTDFQVFPSSGNITGYASVYAVRTA